MRAEHYQEVVDRLKQDPLIKEMADEFIHGLEAHDVKYDWLNSSKAMWVCNEQFDKKGGKVEGSRHLGAIVEAIRQLVSETWAEHVAAERGKDDGEAAASWWLPNDVEAERAKELLQKIDDGDPEVMDRMPYPRISGEMADDSTWEDILEQEGLVTREGQPVMDVRMHFLEEEAFAKYEEAFNLASNDSITKQLRAIAGVEE